MSLFRRWQEYRDRGRVIQESKALLSEARRLLKKHRYRLPGEHTREVSEQADSLAALIRERDIEKIRTALHELEQLVERHLGFARKSTVREYAESIGVAVLVALFLRSFVVEAFKIPSGSMIPTLKVGDHIFVNKFIYGLGWPLSGVKFWQYGQPKRGEIIVFKFPVEPDKDFIKRVVGLAGDTIEMRDNVVFVNDKAVERKHVGLMQYDDWVEDPAGSPHIEHRVADAWQETLDGRTYETFYEVGRAAGQYQPHKVPPGFVFVMGDNRDNSLDSRVWGFVPEEFIKGRALVVWWSRSEADGTRWSRFLPPTVVK